MTDMKLANPPKALIALVAMICMTVLRAVDQMDQPSYNGLVGLIVGYAVGNGIAAQKKEPVQPIFSTKDDDQ